MTDGWLILALISGFAGATGWVVNNRRRTDLARELTQVRDELSDLRNRLGRGVDGLGAALWELNVQGGTLYMSDLFLEITGYQRDEIGGGVEQFFAAVHPDERDRLRETFRAYLDRETAQCLADVRFRCRSGQYTWMHLRAVGSWDESGQARTLVGTVSDITSQMEAEQERDRLFNLSTEMLAVGDYDKYLQQTNPAWVRVLGWSRDELMRRKILHFIHPDDQELVTESFRALRGGEPVEGLSTRFRCRDGSFRWLSWSSFPYPERRLVFSVVRDVTEQKKADHQLLEYQEQLRSLSNQLATVEDRQRRQLAEALHDGLAQQLFGIRAQMVLLKYPDKVPDMTAVVEKTIAILDDAMAATRNLSFELFPPVLYEVGLEAAIVWLAQNFQERSGVSCNVSQAGEQTELPEDTRSMAYQCVRELLVNVKKHAQAGTVEISLNNVPEFLTILVEDDGVGFDMARSEKSRAVGNHGFGLFSIRERLRSIHGRMLVDAKEGRGTRVFLSFPRPESQASNPIEAFRG